MGTTKVLSEGQRLKALHLIAYADKGNLIDKIIMKYHPDLLSIIEDDESETSAAGGVSQVNAEKNEPESSKEHEKESKKRHHQREARIETERRV